jgi:cysteine desulfurase
MKVYLDNAASTPLDPLVIESMTEVMRHQFGNPSAIHAFGREVRAQIELSRRKIASLLHVAPSEIVFTSGGTEADNFAIWAAVHHLGADAVITTSIEHHAVVDTAQRAAAEKGIPFHLLNLDKYGYPNLAKLRDLLLGTSRAFVSLMHANNEIGSMIDLREVAKLCREHKAIFHSDTVQTMGHFDLNIEEIGLDFAACSAHKFHGPKGVGFLYVNKRNKIPSLILGGGQERQMRAGTENVYGIVGMAKALELALAELEQHQNHIQGLKNHMMKRITERIPNAYFNGDPKGRSLYTVLNVSLPPTPKAHMLLFGLDLLGVGVSGGSACSSGASKGSHVLEGIGADLNRPAVRFSFSRFTTLEEVNFAVEKLVEFYKD